MLSHYNSIFMCQEIGNLLFYEPGAFEGSMHDRAADRTKAIRAFCGPVGKAVAKRRLSIP